MAAATPLPASDAAKITGAQNAALGDALFSDTQDLANTSKGISFATAGVLVVTLVGMAPGTSIAIPSGALAAGILHPLEITRLWSAGQGVSGSVVYW